ncbi:MAG: hypothetical protein ABIP17_10605 [Ilumatobacteraceae bacterium]
MPATNAVLFGVLSRFAETLADEFDVADVLYALTDHTVEVLGATAAGVSLTNEHGMLQFVSANSEIATELERIQQESRQGPCHHAFTTGWRWWSTTSPSTLNGRSIAAKQPSSGCTP